MLIFGRMIRDIEMNFAITLKKIRRVGRIIFISDSEMNLAVFLFPAIEIIFHGVINPNIDTERRFGLIIPTKKATVD